jgi:hypothetical protein
MKVVGVGFHRTGTKTLGACCRDHFGMKHRSVDLQAARLLWRGKIDRVMEIVRAHDSFEDWPWPFVYKEIDVRFPDAKFILTVRTSSDVWFASLCRLAAKIGPTEFRRRIYGYEMPDDNEAAHIAAYERHNEAVREYFAAKPGKLLVACWEEGTGWKELCEFLGRDIPDAPFPHENVVDTLIGHGR